MTGTPSETPGEAIRQGGRGQAPAPDLAPGLYLVSTPIGNLRDITLRALDVLAGADRILAEDTRVTRRLLDAYGIRAELQPYHDHNGEKVRPQILEDLEAGARLALVSDAGTPLVSDPGFKLVREAVRCGIAVVAIPGASAVLTALAIAGLPTDSFTFAGFPPQKTGAREAWLEQFRHLPGSLVVYEGVSRLPAALASMAKVLGGSRPAAVCRELTKLYEEARRGTLEELAAHYAEAGPPRGEVVIVIGPPADDDWTEARIDSALETALAEMRMKEAATAVAEVSGWPRRDVYARALALKRGAT